MPLAMGMTETGANKDQRKFKCCRTKLLLCLPYFHIMILSINRC